jgi:hypothetical protein
MIPRNNILFKALMLNENLNFFLRDAGEDDLATEDGEDFCISFNNFSSVDSEAIWAFA